MTPFHNKKIITFIIILKSILTRLKTFPTILIIILKSANSHKNHLKKPQTNIITRINISVAINQINKHKAKKLHEYPNYYKKFHNYIKKFSLIKYEKLIS